MPKFGEYTSGGPGQSTDTILVKRGSTTVRTTLDDLPTPSALAGVLNAKVDTSTFDSTVAQLDADITQGLAVKQDTLNFFGRIQKTGNNVAVDPFISAGSILDGKSTYCVPITGSGFGTFPALHTGVTTVGTMSAVGTGSPGNAANYWQTLTRAVLVSAATAGSQARYSYGPRVRFPLTETSTLNGFKARFTYCQIDTVAGASAFGAFQTLPAAGTAPSAYTGTRVMVYHNKNDTTWKFAVNSEVTDLGANFPVGGNYANPLQFDFEVVPAPNWGINWRVRHMHSGAEASGTYTNAIGGGFNTMLACIRENMDVASAVTFESTGTCTGAWIEAVMGEPAPVVGNTITASQAITRVPHANAENAVNSATPVTLTIANTGFSDRDYFYGTNIGAGAVTIAGDGFTVQKDANVAATVTQYQSFSCQYINGIWVRLS
jgi:hypothetical protein